MRHAYRALDGNKGFVDEHCDAMISITCLFRLLLSSFNLIYESLLNLPIIAIFVFSKKASWWVMYTLFVSKIKIHPCFANSTTERSLSFISCDSTALVLWGFYINWWSN